MAAVLEQDVAVGPFAVEWDGAEFAGGDEFAEVVGVAVEGDGFDAVEEELDVVVLANDADVVPRAGWIGLFVFSRGNEVVKRADATVAVLAKFGIRVAGVVDELEFQADGRSSGRLLPGFGHRREVGLGEDLDAAFRAGSEAKIEFKFEVRILLEGDDGTAGFFAAVCDAAEDAFFDRPTGFREFDGLDAAPAFGGFAIPEHHPAVGFFGGGETIEGGDLSGFLAGFFSGRSRGGDFGGRCFGLGDGGRSNGCGEQGDEAEGKMMVHEF